MLKASILVAALVAACVSPPAVVTTASPRAGARATVADTILALTNRERQRAGVATLAPDARLSEAARIQARQLAETGKLEHDQPGTRYPTLSDRLAAVHYAWSAAGENIAWHYSGARAMATWMTSPHHRQNILDPAYTQVGVAAVAMPDGHTYYVQVFGHPQ